VLSRLRSAPHRALICALALLLLGAGGARAASPDAAATLLARTVADARAQHSFHELIAQVESGTRVGFVADIGASAGRQLITTSKGVRAEVIVSSGRAYLSGNYAALAHYFGFPAAVAAAIGSRWVSFTHADSGYGSVAVDVTAPSAIAELVPVGALRVHTGVSVAGRRLTAIQGAMPDAPRGVASTQTLYVSGGSDPLPVRVSTQLRRGGRVVAHGTILTSAWGEPVAPAPPSRPVAATGLAALARRLAEMTIPRAPGYLAFLGPGGRPPLIGHPWGRACQAVRFLLSGSLPAAIAARVAKLVAAARAQGLAVSTGPAPGAVRVTITAASAAAHGAAGQVIAVRRSTRTLPGGHNVALTGLSATLFTAALATHPSRLPLAIRRLIALSQGIGSSTLPGSGLSAHGADGFTAADVAAMLYTSGCSRVAPGTLAA
jgi:hypothetical protein